MAIQTEKTRQRNAILVVVFVEEDVRKYERFSVAIALRDGRNCAVVVEETIDRGTWVAW